MEALLTFFYPKTIEKRAYKTYILGTLMFMAMALILFILLSLAGYILYRGLPYITMELLTTKPSLVRETIRIFPNILNTLYIIGQTLLIILPIGIGAALYLNEYASNRKIINLIEFTIDALAGIPSIIYGLVGMLFFVQWFSLETSLMAGSLTLAIMTLPLIVRTTQETLKTIPQSYREGAFALGAGKWYALRTVILPSAVEGILTGTILVIGRIVGESAALLFTAGMANEILFPTESFLAGKAGATLTVSLYMYAKERGEFEVAFAIAAILLLLTIVIHLLTKGIALLVSRGKK